ncbi:MAG: hypothetical protein AVDCRST_MAG53-2895, partial [uncultured Solirubrobacteraceae bacterium]
SRRPRRIAASTTCSSRRTSTCKRPGCRPRPPRTTCSWWPTSPCPARASETGRRRPPRRHA